MSCPILFRLGRLVVKNNVLKVFFKHSILLLGLVVFVFFSETAVAQFDIPPKPAGKKEQSAVYDYSKLLNASQKNALETKLTGYAASTSTQIVVVIIATSNNEDLSLLGARWGQKWGIGQAKEDNGILILLAKEDRKIDINTGYGIEYRMTDRMTERIINRVIIPQFKQNNYYEGLDQGTDAIFQALTGEFKETRDFNDGISAQQIMTIVFIFFIIILILRRRNKGGGKNNRSGSGGSLLDIIILSNMGRTGGFGGGGGSFGGGGGFGGGFGGGGFGGGGASGSW
jgi:uncharacterized protein